MTTLHALLLAALTIAPSAFAQDAAVGKDVEDRGDQLETQEKKLETRVFFETEWHEFENLDFRALDESSDQAILDSDDRNGFAFTGISLELGYQVDKSARLVVGTSYRGLWGNDQIGSINRFGGFVYFTSLYAEWKPVRWKYQPTFRLGRQRFDLGGQVGSREFILGDIVDQLRVDLPIPNIGKVILIPINVVGLSAENDDVNFVGFIGQQNSQTFGFRGDRMTRRHGAQLVITPEKLPNLDVRAHAFYTDIGALGSGSDISYNGRLGNFSDNDWVANFGARAAYTFLDGLTVTPFVTFDASVGIDRKELVTFDVDTNGIALAGGVVVQKKKEGPKEWGLYAEATYFQSTGPAFTEDGLQFSHGYVGMKGRHAGGLLANRFMGWHPTAYVGSFGVSDSPQDTSRKAGTRVVAVNTQISLPGTVSFGAGYWFFQDTGQTLLDQGDLNNITPPFGYSREEFAAQARLGKVLAHEINANVGVKLSKHLSLYTQGGVLLPGEFYQTPISRVAGSALGSDDPQLMWDASAGVRMGF
jgi:hypothetical protein